MSIDNEVKGITEARIATLKKVATSIKSGRKAFIDIYKANGFDENTPAKAFTAVNAAVYAVLGIAKSDADNSVYMAVKQLAYYAKIDLLPKKLPAASPEKKGNGSDNEVQKTAAESQEDAIKGADSTQAIMENVISLVAHVRHADSKEVKQAFAGALKKVFGESITIKVVN